MIPPLIVEEAVERGIKVIAITDHNSTANIARRSKSRRRYWAGCLPGMELQTREEVHTLCLFDLLEQAEALQDWVDQRMPALQNNPDFLASSLSWMKPAILSGGKNACCCLRSNLPARGVGKVCELGGWFIPAHVNRQAFGLLNVLGLVPSPIFRLKHWKFPAI
jgi:3',5'-nucleoside bisphosphate phosphatase